MTTTLVSAVAFIPTQIRLSAALVVSSSSWWALSFQTLPKSPKVLIDEAEYSTSNYEYNTRVFLRGAVE